MENGAKCKKWLPRCTCGNVGHPSPSRSPIRTEKPVSDSGASFLEEMGVAQPPA